jgi:hypothetical protein
MIFRPQSGSSQVIGLGGHAGLFLWKDSRPFRIEWRAFSRLGQAR